MSSLKRKKYSKDIRCVFFPDDVRNSVDTAAGSSLSSSSASRSWERCGESFLDIPPIKSSGRTLSAVRKLDRASLSVHDGSFGHHDNDPLNISWTSSESEQSDKESSKQLLAKPVPLKRQERQKKIQKPTARPLHGEVPPISSHKDKDPVSIDWTSSSESELSDNDHGLSLAKAMAPRQQGRLRNTLRQAAAVKRSTKAPAADEEDLPIFDSDSDLKSSGEQLEPDTAGHISECESPPHAVNQAPKSPMPSSDPEVSDRASGGGDAGADAPSRPEPCGEAGGRRVSDWARVAQAMLRTPPRRRPGSESKTPEDSVKKKRKLTSGGFAERLNRLQCRQRSSFSFWRHLSVSEDSDSAATAVRPGVLVLEVLEVQQECSMQLARCQHRLPPTEGNAAIAAARLLVLFNRETASQLMPAPKDIIHVYPPWQRLDIEDGNTTVILNTHFSQKVYSQAQVTDAQTPRPLPPPAKCRPYPLTNTFGPREADAVKGRDTEQIGNDEGVAVGGPGDASWTPGGGHSLLELIEGLGRAGPAGPHVRVAVQRVWSAYVPDRPIAPAVKPRAPPSAATPPPGGRSRLCALVQDGDGIFGVLQLQVLACDGELQRCTHRWQGRDCSLRNLKVVRRVTRERCGRVFHLIDSVWPPTLPFKGGGAASAPCFYYLLSGQQDSLEAPEGPALSPLYLPPKQLTLREALESAGRVSCCSFTATVVHARIQGDTVGQAEGWLVVTDHSLQGEQPGGEARRRTVPVRISTSCVLTSAVAGALRAPAAAVLSFRDVLREDGALLCTEQSVVRTADRADRSELTGPAPQTTGPPAAALPRPVRLDPLGPETAANSLCTLAGVIAGVDEATARSWPACSICGSDRLEVVGVGEPPAYRCPACNCEVEKPALRLQLEVTLASAVSHGSVKAKLHQTTIQSLLNTAALRVDEFPGYEVEHVLGKAVGPIPALVRVVRRTPALWFGVEEIIL